MDSKHVSEIFEALTSSATAIIAFLAWRQIRLLRVQATTTFEDRLTEHYRRIMESIPTDVWLGSGLATVDKEHHDQCRDAIYRYIDLCQEQTILHKMKRITPETWIEWKKGILENMKLPAFSEVWKEIGKKRPDDFVELRILLRS